ncbi:MAG: hypothetical protein ACOC2W_04750 [bacterium]
MNTEKDKKLENFLDDENTKQNQETDENGKKVIKKTKDGLVERVDKTLILEDGRTLLRD